MHLQSGKELSNPPPPKIFEHIDDPQKDKFDKESEQIINRDDQEEGMSTKSSFPQRLERKRSYPNVDALLEGL